MSARHEDLNYGKPLYQETIRWSVPVWAFIIFLDFSIVVAVWAALPISATWITLLILILGTLLSYYKSALKITVTQGWLLVGPAAIERAFIHNFKELDPPEMKRMRGIGASALNYLQIRFWISTGVIISLRDPRDRTPNWIISSKNSAKLIKVLENNQH